jgi:hypothetical protein
MKRAIIILALVQATAAGELGLSTNVVDIPATPGRSVGKIHREDILRGTHRIYTLLMIDRNKDGTYDHIQEMFRFGDKDVFSIGHTDDQGITFEGNDGIQVYFSDSDKDGARDSILLMSKDLLVLDAFALDRQLGYFRPFPPEKLGQYKSGAQKIAPFERNILKTIEEK